MIKLIKTISRTFCKVVAAVKNTKAVKFLRRVVKSNAAVAMGVVLAAVAAPVFVLFNMVPALMIFVTMLFQNIIWFVVTLLVLLFLELSVLALKLRNFTVLASLFVFGLLHRVVASAIVIVVFGPFFAAFILTAITVAIATSAVNLLLL